QLGWRYKPHADVEAFCEWEWRSRIRTNSSGFHDKEYDKTSLAARRRIAVMGDSMVANIAISEDKVFTALLDEQLQPEMSVFNFGVSAYGQAQELLLVDEVMDTTQPMLLMVVVYFMNDITDQRGGIGLGGYERPSARLNSHQELELIHNLSEDNRIQPDRSFYGMLA